ncbi:MAG: glycosyltransferase [Desulfovibrio sp.]
MTTFPRIDDVLKALPQEMENLLLHGSVGSQHLERVAGTGLQRIHEVGCDCTDSLYAMCGDILLHGFGDNPLDGNFVQRVLSWELPDAVLSIDHKAVQLLVARMYQPPKNLNYFYRLQQQRDYDKLFQYLEKQLEREPMNLFWRVQLLQLCLFRHEYQKAEDTLSIDVPTLLAPLFAAQKAPIAWLKGEYDKAFSLYEETESFFGAGYSKSRCAALALQMDNKERALQLFAEALEYSPWATSAMLVYYDLLMQKDTLEALPPGKTTIALYSWNKCEDLKDTLESLFASDIGDAKVVVLNNGSTDGTAAMLDEFKSKHPDQLTIEHLPVNIGAPAARNWLMAMDIVKTSDFTVYLDDDIVLPENWLRKFGAAIKSYPEADVWGCKVADHDSPALMQNADLHLIFNHGTDERTPAPDYTSLKPNPFRFTNLHTQCFDLNNFSYMRPCSSVTGCCHMFRTTTLLDNGGFSLYLSPTQYDDMEHDIRLGKKGKICVYQGHVKILHKRNTGEASNVPGAASGNDLANRYKMQTMHDRLDIADVIHTQQGILRDDINKKAAELTAFFAEDSE